MRRAALIAALCVASATWAAGRAAGSCEPAAQWREVIRTGKMNPACAVKGAVVQPVDKASLIACSANERYAIVQLGSCSVNGFEGPESTDCGPLVVDLDRRRAIDAFDPVPADSGAMGDDFSPELHGDLLVVLQPGRADTELRWGDGLSQRKKLHASFVTATDDGSAVLLARADATGSRWTLSIWAPGAASERAVFAPEDSVLATAPEPERSLSATARVIRFEDGKGGARRWVVDLRDGHVTDVSNEAIATVGTEGGVAFVDGGVPKTGPTGAVYAVADRHHRVAILMPMWPAEILESETDAGTGPSTALEIRDLSGAVPVRRVGLFASGGVPTYAGLDFDGTIAWVQGRSTSRYFDERVSVIDVEGGRVLAEYPGRISAWNERGERAQPFIGTVEGKSMRPLLPDGTLGDPRDPTHERVRCEPRATEVLRQIATMRSGQLVPVSQGAAAMKRPLPPPADWKELPELAAFLREAVPTFEQWTRLPGTNRWWVLLQPAPTGAPTSWVVSNDGRVDVSATLELRGAFRKACLGDPAAVGVPGDGTVVARAHAMNADQTCSVHAEGTPLRFGVKRSDPVPDDVFFRRDDAEAATAESCANAKAAFHASEAYAAIVPGPADGFVTAAALPGTSWTVLWAKTFRPPGALNDAWFVYDRVLGRIDAKKTAELLTAAKKVPLNCEPGFATSSLEAVKGRVLVGSETNGHHPVSCTVEIGVREHRFVLKKFANRAPSDVGR